MFQQNKNTEGREPIKTMEIKINVDFEKKLGRIRPMHGVGQPPTDGLDDELMHYISDAGIPYSRLHDVQGGFGGNLFVDIPNIFRDFDADETDEASYDFVFTDWLIGKLYEHKCEPIYRLGVTIENYHFMKAYRIFPPKDPAKWARICEHIIKHYNEGWADGFHYGIKYWEIWNEPDNGRDDTENQMWHGTPQEFYELYTVAAKHLKSVFGDKIKVGGYATCGFRHIFSDPEKFGIKFEKSDDKVYAGDRSANFLRFFEGFFTYIKEKNAPIDFFSWHSYLTVEKTVAAAEYLDRRLNELGYGGIETQLNEWNNVCEDRSDPLMIQESARKENGTGLAAAKTAAMMCAMQKTKTELLCYYDARIGVSSYAGMFNPLTMKPFPLYYAFAAFNELYRLGNEVECSYNSTDGFFALAAEGNGKKAVMLANTSGHDFETVTDLPEGMSVYIVDDTKMLEKTDLSPGKFVFPKDSIILIK